MSRVPELYLPEQDQLSRAEGSIYIEDLLASHVLIALKQNCAPQGLGFINAQPVSSNEVNVLHTQMVEALDSSESELEHGLYVGEIAVRSDYDDPSIVNFNLDYWQGRPMKTTLRTGPNTDREMLTGFQAFDPWGFDRDQGQGVAQNTIDALRATGDFRSMDVVAHEGGRTFDRVGDAKNLLGGLLLSAIKGKENPELAERLAKALETYDEAIEG